MDPDNAKETQQMGKYPWVDIHGFLLLPKFVNFGQAKVKGYISKKQRIKCKKQSITLICPYRSCRRHIQKKQNTKKELMLLKDRYIVEHLFKILRIVMKNYRKLRMRYDALVASFEGFVMLACMDIVISKRNITSLEFV